jgi:hypothetical protein
MKCSFVNSRGYSGSEQSQGDNVRYSMKARVGCDRGLFTEIYLQDRSSRCPIFGMS